jgi:hypothetical protein
MLELIAYLVFISIVVCISYILGYTSGKNYEKRKTSVISYYVKSRKV